MPVARSSHDDSADLSVTPAEISAPPHQNSHSVRDDAKEVILSIVMPCLNEEESIGECITRARKATASLDLSSEIVICDNGSTDGSVDIAKSLGARVVHQPLRGYGNAYRKGIAEARGTFIVIADSDGTYPFEAIPRFVSELENGSEFVMGSRLRGSIERGAMPWLHRYIGNPALTATLNLFFRAGISDAHCGMRAFRKDAYDRLNLQTSGMEFASEMVIEAARKNLQISEVPLRYSRRIGGETKLNTWNDGWRHLRFMLLESPQWVFTIPGALLTFFGFLFLGILARGPVTIGGQTFDIHMMVFSALVTILGTQTLWLGVAIKTYAKQRGFTESDRVMKLIWSLFTLERGVIAGSVIALIGIGAFGILVVARLQGIPFEGTGYLRIGVVSLVLTLVGVQAIFHSFFLCMIGADESSQL